MIIEKRKKENQPRRGEMIIENKTKNNLTP
jgi:hypothetical protein